jgi:hypothetical protein
MPGISDYMFQTPQTSPRSRERRRSRTPAIIGVVVAAVAAYYIWFSPAEAPAPAKAVAEAQASAPPAAVETNRYELPPLADSDEFMRERIGTVSSHPLVAAWLKTTDLARNLVVVIENVARGLTPSKHLLALRPQGTFRVITRPGSRTFIHPRNYDRFNGLAEAATSLDPAAVAMLYTAIKPLLQTAYDELGNQESIDRALERALSGLLNAPVVDDEIRVEIRGPGIGYRFVDPDLEALTGAQKQLIRMGPVNQRIIQGRLRQFAQAAALGGPRTSTP